MTDPNATPTASAVVVGVDGTEAALNAVRWAAADAVLRRLPLRILHAATYADLSNQAGRSAPEAARARAILARAFTVARREQPGLAVSTELVGAGPTRALEQASATADLLVLGISGAGGLDEVVIDSVALEVSGQGHCPVVVVRSARRSAGPGRRRRRYGSRRPRDRLGVRSGEAARRPADGGACHVPRRKPTAFPPGRRRRPECGGFGARRGAALAVAGALPGRRGRHRGIDPASRPTRCSNGPVGPS